jgi:hypothetical protein
MKQQNTSPSNKRKIISFEETPKNSPSSQDGEDSFPEIQVGRSDDFEPCDVIARIKRRKLINLTNCSKVEETDKTLADTTIKSAGNVSLVSTHDQQQTQFKTENNTYTQKLYNNDDNNDNTQRDEETKKYSSTASRSDSNTTLVIKHTTVTNTRNLNHDSLQLEYTIDELDFGS